MKRGPEGYVVITEFGPVLVRVNPAARNGLETDMLLLSAASESDRSAAVFETPLRAFAAKMVDIINSAGFDGVNMSGPLREMMEKEKESDEQNRSERGARASQ